MKTERQMIWNREHKEIVYARIRKIKNINPKKYKAIDKAWRDKNKEHLEQYRKENRDRILQNERERRRKIKIKVFSYYGGNPPKCNCCNENNFEFLSLDHVNGGGKQHRKSLKDKGGYGIYNWIIKNNFPLGFQILCMNCNWAKRHSGYCPHQKREIEHENN